MAQTNRELKEVALGHYMNSQSAVTPHTASMMGDLVLELGKDNRTNSSAIAKINSYIRKNNVEMHPKALEFIRLRSSDSTLRNSKGLKVDTNEINEDILSLNVSGLYINGYDNHIFVRRMGFPGKINKGVTTEVANATQRSLDAIERLNYAAAYKTPIRPDDEEAVASMGYTNNYTARDVLTYLHELGHSIHSKTRYAPPSFYAKDYKLKYQWDMNVTEYGSTNMAEGFAEYFVAYATAGKRLKAELPEIYDFIDSVVDKAVKAKPIVHPPLPRHVRGSMSRTQKPKTYDENVKRAQKVLPRFGLSQLHYAGDPMALWKD